MKLTQEQYPLLRKLVRDMVSYRETYSELYDHILTAVEDAPERHDLLEVVDGVVEEDFGGYQQLFTMEDERAKLVAKTVKVEHWINVKQYFRLPLLIFTILLGMSTYFAIGNLFSVRALEIINSILPFVPLIIAKLMQTGPNDVKNSIKEEGIIQLAQFSMITLICILNLPSLFYHDNRFVLLAKVHSVCIVILFILYAVYSLGFIKLIKKEFILRLTT